MLVCDFTVRIPPVKKCKFTPRIRSWKLKDPAVASQFHDVFGEKGTAARSAARPDVKSVESMWSRLKVPLLDVATEVCGLSKTMHGVLNMVVE